MNALTYLMNIYQCQRFEQIIVIKAGKQIFNEYIRP